MSVPASALAPLVDCDYLLYSCGYVYEYAEDDVNKENPDPDVSFALSRLKKSLTRILDTFPDRPYQRLFLSGDGNYRYEIAKTKAYKSTRRQDKPIHFAAMKQYLFDYWQAERVDGREADDAIATAQWAAKDKSTVICSVDKDLKTCPGWFFNVKTHELRYISLSEANRYFLKQVLTGDTVDAIPGLPGYGPKKADKLIPEGISLDEGVQILVNLYEAEGFSKEYLKEQLDLLWICRKESEQGFPYWGY